MIPRDSRAARPEALIGELDLARFHRAFLCLFSSAHCDDGARNGPHQLCDLSIHPAGTSRDGRRRQSLPWNRVRHPTTIAGAHNLVYAASRVRTFRRW